MHSAGESFEQDWLQGKATSLEAQLQAAPVAIQDVLFEELLTIELELRIDANDTPSLTELHRRFPNQHATIERVTSELAKDGQVPQFATSVPESLDTELRTAAGAGSDFESLEAPGARIGPYELQERIGVGGMGSVWRAHQRQPVSREVAIKLIKVGMDTREVVARFETERQALAMMDHPNIARVLDAGSTVAGRPYFVMELVKGEKITDFCDTHQLDLDARLDLFNSVCDAVQHAHQKGVIHRDLKPSNVLVTGTANAPHAKVIDFGLAKATEQQLTDLTLVTAVGQVMGTPHCMSPEQATLSKQDVDTRTDVYSLGVLLYELLTGVPPFDFDHAGESSYDAILRSIRETEPPRLSSRVAVVDDGSAAVAQNRGTTAKSLHQALRGDLDVIAHKAIEKDRTRRYQTPRDFADDIQRYRSSEAIEARPTSLLYRLRKTAKRNQAAVIFVSLLIATLIAGSAVSIYHLIRARSAERSLASQLELANTLRLEAETRTELERWERYRSTMNTVSNALDAAEDAQLARLHLDNAPLEHRGWEWSHFDSRIQDTSLMALDYGTGNLSYCPVFALHPQRWQLGLHQPDGVLTTWDSGPLPSHVTNREYPIAAAAIAYSRDGKLVAISDDDHVIHIWNTDNGKRVIQLVGHELTVLRLAFRPNSAHIATGGFGSSVRIWDIQTGDQLYEYPTGSPCMALEYTADGSQLLISSGIDVVTLESDQHTVVNRFQGPTAHVEGVILSADGTLLAGGTSHPENKVFVWDFSSGELLAELEGHTNQLTGLAFDNSSERLVSSSMDQTLRLWDWKSGQAIHVFRGHAGPVYSVTFNPDGTRLASGSNDETARLWSAETGEQLAVLRGHGAQVAQVAFNHEGSRVISASFDGTVRIWDSSLQKTVLPSHTQFVYDVAFHPKGDRVASVGWDGRLVQTSLDSDDLETSEHPSDVVTSVAYDATGTRLVTLCRRANAERVGRDVMIWNAESGELLHTIPVPGANILESRADVSRSAGTASEGNSLIAVGDDAGRVFVFDLQTGKQRATLKGHGKGIFDVAFRPTSAGGSRGVQLATASEDLTIRIWDVEQQQSVATLEGHNSHVYRVLYSPDGKLLASASNDRTVRLWDGSDYRPLAELHHGSTIYGLAFSPDGKRLATACADSTIRLWDIARRAEVARLRGHEKYVHAVAFSPDGTRLVSGSGDSTLRVWDTLTRSARAGGE